MKRELLRLAYRIIGILSSIRDNIQSINNQRRSETKNDDPPRHANAQVEIQLPPAVTEHYESEKRDAPKYIRRDRIRLLVEFLTLGAAIGAGVFAYRSFGEVKKQANAATDQVKIMRSAQSPWLGLSEQIRLETTSFRFFNPERVNVNLVGSGVIKNFGTSPAFNVNGMVIVNVPPPTDTVTRPDKKWMTCPEGLTIQHRGEIVFPGSGYVQGFNHQTSVAIVQHPEIGRIWLLGCVVYHTGCVLRTLIVPHG
jgi:hypothetical protein